MVAPENKHKWRYWLYLTGLLGGPAAVFLEVFKKTAGKYLPENKDPLSLHLLLFVKT